MSNGGRVEDRDAKTRVDKTPVEMTPEETGTKDKTAEDKPAANRVGPRDGGRTHSAWLAPGLALKDLRHEWVLTSTLVLAIGAVVAPLLILLGLKFGVVEFHLTRLIEDPTYREITPARTQEIPPETIEAWRARDDVAFVTPGISRGASSVTVQLENAPQRRMDILPSLPGDPLLTENGAPAPDAGQVVLSYAAAQRLLAAAAERDAALDKGEAEAAPAVISVEEMRAQLVGETAVIKAGRQTARRRQSIDAPLTIAGVLDPRADPLDRIYAPFDLVEALEEYRSGFRDDLEGRAEKLPEAFASYDQVIVTAAEPIGRVARARMRDRTGVADVTPIGDPLKRLEAARLSGEPPAPGAALSLRGANTALLASNLNALRRALARTPSVQTPLIDPFEARFEREGGAPTTLTLMGEPDAEAMAAWGGAALLPARWRGGDGAPIAAPKGSELAVGTKGVMVVPFADYEVRFPAVIAAESAGPIAYAPMEVAAQLRTGQLRRIIFDPESESFRLTKEGYRGFRLYAASIYDVAGLARFFLGEGVDIVTQEGQIQVVEEMDRALTQLFWLVAVVGIIGAIAAMVASLVAAVERKRAEIGMMRLLGLTKRAIFMFPIVQSLAVAFIATLFAVGAFLGLSEVINRAFASALPLGERLCHLPPSHLAITFAITMAIAAASALLASVRATRIDPADAIRQE